jgi:hypothetical protein
MVNNDDNSTMMRKSAWSRFYTKILEQLLDLIGHNRE